MMENPLMEPPDPTQRRCYDCVHMKGAVSWWCTNDEAVEARGTKIPGVYDCDFWEPGHYEKPKKRLTLWQRIFGT